MQKTPTYRVKRFYQDERRKPELVERHLTLAEAKRLCAGAEGSSKTATSDEAVARTRRWGAWFLGFVEE